MGPVALTKSGYQIVSYCGYDYEIMLGFQVILYHRYDSII